MVKRNNDGEAANGLPNKKAKQEVDENCDEDLEPEEDEEESVDSDADAEDLTESQKYHIAEIKKLLKRAYKDAPAGTYNPNIRNLIKEWRYMKYRATDKSRGGSLARIFHVEKGWSAEGMLKLVGGSNYPIALGPLWPEDSRALWAALKYRNNLNGIKATCVFEVDLPEEWYGITLKYKTFRKNGGTDFAKKLAAAIAFNHMRFFGKKDYWFRPICEELGFDLSDTFSERFRSVIMVVCVSPELVQEKTEHIEGSWCKDGNRDRVKKAFVNAVKDANAEDIEYPKTLALFKKLFPKLLK